MNKHYWVSGYLLSHDLSGWARNNRGTCEWVDINKNETKNSVCGKSPVCKQPDTPLMFIRLELSWYPDRYGQSPGGNIFWLMFTLTAYLLSQVSLLPAVTVLHLHVLYPWVHIHLGHAGIKEKPVLNKPLSPSKLCYYSKLNRTQCQYLSNSTDKEYLRMNTEAG